MSEGVVTGYSVVEAASLESLVHKITQAIDENWEPIGGVSVVHSSFVDKRYVQALIKRESAVKDS